MECKEIRVDVRTASIKERTEGQRQTKILFQINHTMPFTDEYNHLLKELFGNNLGDGSMISPPLNGACVGSVKIGRNVFINSNLLAMARGGITIEDNAMIAANVQLISNNHDPYVLVSFGWGLLNGIRLLPILIIPSPGCASSRYFRCGSDRP